jgi:threonine/homoserine/homoserine lactone efflux protein
MWGTQDIAAFLAAGVLLNLTPGQDTLYILGRSMAQGKRAGILSVLGISSGILFHTVAAATGLSAILAASSMAFTWIRWAGAAYLAFLGARMILGKGALGQDLSGVRGPVEAGRIYRQGVLTNVLNPKVALFFLAFLPQFVDPNCTSPIVPFLVLGGLFMATGTAWCLCLVLLSSRLTAALRRGRLSILAQRACGILFIGLGLKLALEQGR